MKKYIILILVIPFFSFAQENLSYSNFPEAINGNTPLDIAFSVIPSLRPETEENLRLRHHIVQLLVNSGGRHKPQDVSSLSSGPSDPDYELMDNLNKLFLNAGNLTDYLFDEIRKILNVDYFLK